MGPIWELSQWAALGLLNAGLGGLYGEAGQTAGSRKLLASAIVVACVAL